MRANAVLALLISLSACGDVVKSGVDGGGESDASGDGATNAPTIAAMTPDWGSMEGGTNVRITGSGFSSAGLAVMFGAATAVSVTVVSDTELLAVTPAGPHSPVDVTIATGGGSATFATKFRNLAPLYGADGRSVIGSFYTIDPMTGAAAAVGALPFAVTGLALSPDGVLYANTTGAPTRLVVINPYTAATTTVGSIMINGASGGATDLAFQGTKLLGWRTNTMVEINTSTAVETPSPAALLGGGCGVASLGPTTMAFTPKSANQQIYTVNTTNGVATPGATMNGPAGESINALTFVGDTMYGSVVVQTGGVKTARLFAINPATGAMTLRGSLPANIDAIEGIPTQPALARVVDAAGTQEPRPQAAPVVDAPPMIALRGRAMPVAEVLAVGADRVDGDRVRRVVPLAKLSRFARGNSTVELVSGDGSVRRSSLTDRNFALVPNSHGELKLVDLRDGYRKVFGPITELRFAR